MMLLTSFIFSHNFRILASYNPTILQICFFSWCVRENSLHLPSLNL